jgi:6,7-dimethyl-8-ribityllumazine synthase
VSDAERPGVFDHEVEPVAPPPGPPRETPPVRPAPEPDPPVAAAPPAAEEDAGVKGPEAPPALERQPSELPAAPEAPAPSVGAPAATPPHAAGELQVPPGIRVFDGSPNGARRSVGIAVSRFNGEITSKLLEGALRELSAAGVAPEAIEVMPVPGAFELPLAAMALAKSRRYSCVLALGCVIRGETPHFDYVSAEAASGVQLAGLETGIPVAFGVLTCDTAEQAEARAGGVHGNKGVEAARSALEMVESLSLLRATLSA